MPECFGIISYFCRGIVLVLVFFINLTGYLLFEGVSNSGINIIGIVLVITGICFMSYGLRERLRSRKFSHA